MNEPIRKMIDRMEAIRIEPHMTAGFSMKDQKTGRYCGPQDFSISLKMSLWKLMLGTGAAAALVGGICFCKKQRVRHEAKKNCREKLKAWKKKMSKS